MRIAFFGGTFDPPHRGHLAIARAAISRLELDRVLVAPVGMQPLKDNESLAPYEARLAMVRLAVQGDPQLVPCSLDAPRPDGQPNYTLDTLAALRQTLAATDKLFCLLGADALFSFRHWHRAAELLLFCDFIVASRPGFPLDRISSLLPNGIKEGGLQEHNAACPNLVRMDLAGPAGNSSSLYLLPGLEEDISATEIRAALADGWETQTVLAPAVAQYIRAHGLYQGSGIRDQGSAPSF
jgi:nicotinate-nucleotide adenylyltransferase